MKLLHVLYAGTALEDYRSGLTGEQIGWAIQSEPSLAFRPVHRIECHIEDGPVVILGDSVFEVDPEADEVFATDEQAMDVYYSRK